MDIINLGNRISNTYLIKLEKGYLLVDTGYAEQFVTFCKRLKYQNININEIQYIFLTHAHDDHAGFLNDILEKSNARVIIHKQAMDGLKLGQNCFSGGCSSKTALAFCKLMNLLGKGEHKYPPLKENFYDRCITIDENNREHFEKLLSGRIIETPGHTSCSISLLMRDGSLFCGDAAMNGVPSKRRVTIWIENVSNFHNSWVKIIELKPSRIYCGHGKPFTVNDLTKYLPKLNSITLYSLK